MAYVDWMIRGPKLGACSCAYGCPCEFNAPPTHGWCQGFEGQLIEQGFFGDVRLDGLIVGARYRWPGPVHDGGGLVQGFIDERADERQRDALFKILGGEEQEPTTVFNIYGSTIERELDPIFGTFEFECDLANRVGKFVVPGVGRIDLSPIKNPVTGANHYAQIVLPDGFEFRKADMASADLDVIGDELAMAHEKSYGVMWIAAYGPYGIIEDLEAA